MIARRGQRTAWWLQVQPYERRCVVIVPHTTASCAAELNDNTVFTSGCMDVMLMIILVYFDQAPYDALML